MRDREFISVIGVNRGVRVSYPRFLLLYQRCNVVVLMWYNVVVTTILSVVTLMNLTFCL